MLASASNQAVPTSAVGSTTRSGTAPLQHLPTWPSTVERMLEKLHGEIQSGRQEFRIQLAPAELGRVEVRLAERGEGLTVRVVADRPEVAAALRHDLPRLEQSLQQTGISLASLDVQARGFGGSSLPQDAPGQDRQAQHSAAAAAAAATTTIRPTSTKARRPLAANRIDLMV